MSKTLLSSGAAVLALVAVPATGQTTSADPAVAPAPQPTVTDGKRTYTPADFARFAPRTAYDMLVQVPGFTIRGADQSRGLGQATENVLINGQRIADKSGGALDQLRTVPATSVVRIEIVDAASLGLAGLTGQVANVIVKSAKAGSGQFEWTPDFRAHFSKPNLYSGSISYSGKTGPVDYTVSLQDDGNRGGFGGPVVITGPTGAVVERRDELFHGESDLVTLKTRLGFDGPGSSTAHLTLSVTPYWAPSYDRERRIRADGDHRTRVTQSRLAGTYYDINADAEAALGPGRLKLIGVRHFDHEPVVTTQVTRFDSGAPAVGIRLSRNSHIGETIGRAEYGWKGGKNAWQLSFERAFNSLDQRGSLAILTPAGSFAPTPFPGGSGQVQEVRYEGTATLSRPLGRALDFQLVVGAEKSTLARVDGDVPPRRFFRPKGSVSLGWRPAKAWDASLKVSRRVGQISFYDFLEQPNLQQDRQNAGNPDLVPPQSWETEAQVGHELGPWGKTRLKLFYNRISDLVEIIPVGLDGEGVGNLPSATSAAIESVSTIQFDPIGWTGAKLDAKLGLVRSRVRDPLTGLSRQFNGKRSGYVSLQLRHDVPHTPYAWGGGLEYGHRELNYRLSEVFYSNEGPVFTDLFVEHKNVFGLTVRAQAINLFNARHRLERDVYGGYRTVSPLLFHQSNNQLIGPIFALKVSGTF